MVHTIKLLKCKKGHHIGVSFDSNECGCCMDGKPYIIINCRECFMEALKKDIPEVPTKIPLCEEGVKIVKELIKDYD